MTNNINRDKIYDRTDDISRKKSLIRVLHHLKIMVKIKSFWNGHILRIYRS